MEDKKTVKEKQVLVCASCNSTDIHQKASVWIIINDPSHVIDMDDLFYGQEFWCCKCNQKVNIKAT